MAATGPRREELPGREGGTGGGTGVALKPALRVPGRVMTRFVVEDGDIVSESPKGIKREGEG
jgi:hypothetical protein